MYLLIVKDGFVSRYFGPYLTPKDASSDLQGVLAEFSSRARWQINLLENPCERSFSEKSKKLQIAFNAKAS